jgi:hypothetical protein
VLFLLPILQALKLDGFRSPFRDAYCLSRCPYDLTWSQITKNVKGQSEKKESYEKLRLKR